MSESAIVITTVLSILVIVDVVGNSLVCAIVKKNRDMRCPIQYLLVNLAVADILFAVFIAPRVFFKLPFIHHPDGMTGTVLCKLLTDGNVAVIAAASSFVTLVAIAVERYYAVIYPLGNKGKLNRSTLKVIISVSWIFALILSIPQFLVTDIVNKKSRNSCVSIWPKDWLGEAYSVTSLVIVLVSLSLMCGLYSRVVYTLWFKSNAVDNELTFQQKGVVRLRKRVTLMVFIITAIFGICWGTALVVYVLKYVTFHHIGPVPFAIINTLVLFNSAVNPFVYALLNQQFRKKLKEMICCNNYFLPMVRHKQNSWNIQLAQKTITPEL